MLHSAVLRALADIHSNFMRIDPHFVNAIRNQIRLSRKTRNPKAVVRVRGKQFQESGRGMRGIADRNVQFICSDDPQRGVSKFPPELMADDGDLDRSLGHAGILNGMDDAGRSHEEHQHNEHRNHCPGEFDLIAAVNLRRLRAIVAGACGTL